MAIFVTRRTKLEIAECAIDIAFTIVKVIWPVLGSFQNSGFLVTYDCQSLFLFDYVILELQGVLKLPECGTDKEIIIKKAI